MLIVCAPTVIMCPDSCRVDGFLLMMMIGSCNNFFDVLVD